MDKYLEKFLRKLAIWHRQNKNKDHQHQFIKVCAICGKYRAEYNFIKRKMLS